MCALSLLATTERGSIQKGSSAMLFFLLTAMAAIKKNYLSSFILNRWLADEMEKPMRRNCRREAQIATQRQQTTHQFYSLSVGWYMCWPDFSTFDPCHTLTDCLVQLPQTCK
jgi:hypothetical protein